MLILIFTISLVFMKEKSQCLPICKIIHLLYRLSMGMEGDFLVKGIVV